MDEARAERDSTFPPEKVRNRLQQMISQKEASLAKAQGAVESLKVELAEATDELGKRTAELEKLQAMAPGLLLLPVCSAHSTHTGHGVAFPAGGTSAVCARAVPAGGRFWALLLIARVCCRRSTIGARAEAAAGSRGRGAGRGAGSGLRDCTSAVCGGAAAGGGP